MPRLARTVFAGVPHHVTQPGNRREDVFFTEEHRHRYLEWLAEYCRRYEVEVLAYCLMTNHVHLVMVPTTETGLNQVLKLLHIIAQVSVVGRIGVASLVAIGHAVVVGRLPQDRRDVDGEIGAGLANPPPGPAAPGLPGATTSNPKGRTVNALLLPVM